MSELVKKDISKPLAVITGATGAWAKFLQDY